MYRQADVCPSGSLGQPLRPIAVSAKSLQSILRLGLGLITEVIWGFARPPYCPLGTQIPHTRTPAHPGRGLAGFSHTSNVGRVPVWMGVLKMRRASTLWIWAPAAFLAPFSVLWGYEVRASGWLATWAHPQNSNSSASLLLPRV